MQLHSLFKGGRSLEGGRIQTSSGAKSAAKKSKPEINPEVNHEGDEDSRGSETASDVEQDDYTFKITRRQARDPLIRKELGIMRG